MSTRTVKASAIAASLVVLAILPWGTFGWLEGLKARQWYRLKTVLLILSAYDRRVEPVLKEDVSGHR